MEDSDLLVALDPAKPALRFEGACGGVMNGHRAILEIARAADDPHAGGIRRFHRVGQGQCLPEQTGQLQAVDGQRFLKSIPQVVGCLRIPVDKFVRQ